MSPTAAPPPPVVEDDSAVPPGGPAESEGGGVGLQSSNSSSLGGVLPGMLEALAVEQQQQQRPENGNGEQGRLDDVSLAGGGAGRGAEEAGAAGTAGAAGVRGKGRRRAGGEDALTVRAGERLREARGGVGGGGLRLRVLDRLPAAGLPVPQNWLWEKFHSISSINPPPSLPP